MNYEEARQIGPGGPVPGKWNWTNRHDGHISTIEPCAWPDYERPGIDPVTATYIGWAPTGRERCDHDTREEAERHHHTAALARVTIDVLDLDDIRERRRCHHRGSGDGCREWETHRANWHDGYRWDSLCEEHATFDMVAAIHPFVPGMQKIHS